MLNIISSENPQNNINNQSSSVNPQFIGKKNLKLKKKIKEMTTKEENIFGVYLVFLWSLLVTIWT
jgi:hypothetical protein